MSIKPALRATLHEISLHSDAPSRLAAFYEAGLGYCFAEDHQGFLGVGRSRRLRLTPGAPNTLDYAAYALTDGFELATLAKRLDACGVAYERRDVVGFAPGTLSVHDPDGNHFLFGLAAGDVETFTHPVADRAARLQHVVFASPQPQALLDFYVDVLGFVLSDRVLDEAGGLRTAFVRCSHEHHSLAVFKADRSRIDHHCYEAEDWGLIRDWADHFAGLRVPLKWGPGRHGPGDNLFLFVVDPDGNWVEISAELEQVEADRPAGIWPHEERTLNSWGAGFLRS